MKSNCQRIKGGILAISLMVSAVLADEKLPLLKVGKDCYTNVTVTEVTVTDIYFTHAHGMGNAKLKDLEPELQRHFGYSPAVADAAEKSQAEARARYHEWLVAQPVVRPPDMTREPPVPVKPDPDPQIVGSQQFSNQVSKALQLLKARDGDAYATAKHFIGKIQETAGTNDTIYIDPPSLDLRDTSVFDSETWCASTIAHSSWHAKIYQDCHKMHSGVVSDDAWKGVEAEQQCLQYQLQVLDKIGAPPGEIGRAKALAAERKPAY
jgi:hypothetical protein